MPAGPGTDGVGSVQSNARPAAPPPDPSGPPPSALDGLLTADLAPVTASARRRASRDGDRQIDTAHLLHSLIEADPQVRAAFEPTQIARLLGYLVQRSIGFGLQWQTAVESSGEIPVVTRRDGEDCRRGGNVSTVPGAAKGRGAASVPRTGLGAGSAAAGARGQERWSPAAAMALRRAASRARRHGREQADGTDLLAALAADGESRAVEVLRSAGVDIDRTVSALPN